MTDAPLPSRSIRIGRWTLPLPRSPALRIGLGLVLIVGGVLSFLPVLGIWMIPLGFLVLSIDFPRVRRWRRRFAVWFARRFPKIAARLHVEAASNGDNGRPHERASLRGDRDSP
jgi:hypothetical protein